MKQFKKILTLLPLSCILVLLSLGAQAAQTTAQTNPTVANVAHQTTTTQVTKASYGHSGVNVRIGGFGYRSGPRFNGPTRYRPYAVGAPRYVRPRAYYGRPVVRPYRGTPVYRRGY